ncbi:hypothetical protein V6N13_072673 [Hibiscus sabdariffa]|uniref:Uncharacterized protein n=1 Tax=Hibiscus sabdariffa TaxID=183260 RepID=A0ABR2E6S4_9ROSI
MTLAPKGNKVSRSVDVYLNDPNFYIDIVFRNPELVVRAALQEVAKKREMRYGAIRKIEKGIRRHFHDDSTVVVIYLD